MKNRSRRGYIKRFPEFLAEQHHAQSLLAPEPKDSVEKIVKQCIADSCDLDSRLIHSNFDLHLIIREALELNGYEDRYFQGFYDSQIAECNMLMSVEENLDIEISNEDMDQIKTVGELVALCRKLVRER